MKYTHDLGQDRESLLQTIPTDRSDMQPQRFRVEFINNIAAYIRQYETIPIHLIKTTMPKLLLAANNKLRMYHPTSQV